MKSPLTKIIIKIALAVIAIAAVFYFLFSPKLSQLAQNQIEVARLGADLKEADNKLKELRGYEKTKDELALTKKQVFDLLPEEASASSFILNIEQSSSTIPIIVDSLSVNELKTAKTTPKATTETDSTKETTAATPAPTKKAAVEKALTFSASFTSDYEKAQQFLKSMHYLSRFNTIETITLGGYNITDNTINLKAEGKIYYGR